MRRQRWTDLILFTLIVVALMGPVAWQALAAGTYRATVTWVDQSLDETGFEVEYMFTAGPALDPLVSRGGNWQHFARTGPNQTSLQRGFPADVEGGIWVCFRVIAVSGNSRSLPSAESCTQLPSGPTPPSNVGAVVTTIP